MASINKVNVYIVGIFMYKHCNDNVSDIFDGLFRRNSKLHNKKKYMQGNQTITMYDLQAFMWRNLA